MTRWWTGSAPRLLALVTAGGALAAMALAAAPPPEIGEGVVATDHRLASEAGAEILRSGGNAADAAVAAALAAGVVQSAGSGLGGGGFAVVVEPGPDGARAVLDFREVAPAGATRDMYIKDNGKVSSKRSRRGALAVAVPAESRGLARLLAERGSLQPMKVAAPAIRHASQGYVVEAHLAEALSRTKYDEVQALFSVDGTLAVRGVRVKNKALAGTLKRWAASRGEDLHTGRGAAAIAARMASDEGLVTADDLARVMPKDRAPIVTHFGEHTLITMPPPSSGGVVLAQVLQVLDGYDLESLGHNSSDYLHLITEAMKHAYADRAHHLGDPDHVKVDVDRLLGDARIDAIRHEVWPGRTFGPEHYGALIAPPTDGGTQHISVLDKDGMGVALTTTINTSFGSGVVVSDLGLPLNNEMDDFSAQPGAPNAYGLVGSEANAVAPGKRPLSSMTPTVVLDKEGRVVMVIGASGGSTIISGTLQVYLNMAVFDMDPQAAGSAPRIHHQWLPDTLFVEPEIPLDVRQNLEKRGHTLDVRPGFTAVQAVRKRAGGVVEGGSDPRKGGWPAGTR